MIQPRIPERDILKTILDYLKLRRVFHYRQNVGAFIGSHKGKTRFTRFGVPGIPDIVCIVKGQYVGIEVKSPSKHPSQAQVEFSVSLTKAGGIYLVAHSLEEVRDFFEKEKM